MQFSIEAQERHCIGIGRMYLKLMINGTPVVKNWLVYFSQMSTSALGFTHLPRLNNECHIADSLVFGCTVLDANTPVCRESGLAVAAEWRS